MDGPTKVLTIGIGALAAVAAYLGWQNSTDTPEIIDSEVYDYDSRVNQRNKTKVAGTFSNTIESDEEKQDEVIDEVAIEEQKTETVEEQNTELVKEPMVEEPKVEETKVEEPKVEEVQEVRAEVKAEVKQHMDKLPNESPWGTFWRSEYDDIVNEKSSN